MIKNPSEVTFTLIDPMKNKRYIQFKKENGKFEVSGLGQDLGNYQMKTTTRDLEWAADDGDWDEIAESIETGIMKIVDCKSR